MPRRLRRRVFYLFPAWPEEWDVDFKLHASQGTIVEGTYNSGELMRLEVHPESRRADFVVTIPAGLGTKD